MMFLSPNTDLWVRQPPRTLSLKKEFLAMSAFAYNFCQLKAYNVGNERPGLALSGSPALVRNANGWGVALASGGANMAYGGTTTNTPIKTSTWLGQGAFSILTIFTAVQESSRKTLFHYAQTAINSQLYIIVNGYLAENATGFSDSAGTLWCGGFQPAAGNGRGVQINGVITGAPLRVLFSRDESGLMEVWINGALAASANYPSNIIDTFGSSTDNTGIGINGREDTTGAGSSVHSINMIYAANTNFTPQIRKELSSNPWMIFEKPNKRFWLTEGGSTENIINTIIGAGVGGGLNAGISNGNIVNAGVAAGGGNGLTATVASENTIITGVGVGVATGFQTGIITDSGTISCGVGAGVGSGVSSSISSPVQISTVPGQAVAAGLQINIISASIINSQLATALASGLQASISNSESDLLTDEQLKQVLVYIKSNPMILTIPKWIALRDSI